MPLKIIGGIGSAVGGIAGQIGASGEAAQASALQQKAMNEILSVQDPVLQKLALEKYKKAGIITPELENVVNQAQTQMAGISTDPRLKQAQMQALSSLQGLGETGLTAQDKAQLAQISRQTSQEEQAKEQAILQNMQARGMGGSGAELAAKLSASQASANNAQQAGENVAAQAQARALQAIAQSGALGGQMQSQEFGQKSQIAQAADAIARFNAANQQNVQNTNVQTQNAAQVANLQALQNILNQNTGLSNQQQVYNQVNLPQQQFQNQMTRAKAVADAATKSAQQHATNASNIAGAGSAIGQGIGDAFSSFADQLKPNNENIEVQPGEQNLTTAQENYLTGTKNKKYTQGVTA